MDISSGSSPRTLLAVADCVTETSVVGFETMTPVERTQIPVARLVELEFSRKVGRAAPEVLMTVTGRDGGRGIRDLNCRRAGDDGQRRRRSYHCRAIERPIGGLDDLVMHAADVIGGNRGAGRRGWVKENVVTHG